MNFIQSDNESKWIHDVVSQIKQELNQIIQRKKRATLIVAGGSTPANIYTELGGQDINFNQVTIIPSDERWVMENSERSNLRMIKSSFTVNSSISANFIPLYLDQATPETVAPIISSTIKPYLPADICILGMGNDMHTASLFPNTPETKFAMADKAPFVVPTRMPKTDEIRISLSKNALISSNKIILLIKGIQKKVALEKALKLKNPIISPIYPFLNDATVYFVE